MEDNNNNKTNDSPLSRKSLKRTNDPKRTLREEDQERTLEKDLSKQQIDLTHEELEGFILNYLYSQARKVTAKTTALIRTVVNTTLQNTPKSETYTEENMKKLIDENLAHIRENTPEEIENMEEPDWKYKVHGASFQGLRLKMEDRSTYSPYVNHLFALPSDAPKDIFYVGVYDGHGGSAAADYTQAYLHVNIMRSPHFQSDYKKALSDGFVKTDQKYCERAKRVKDRSGTTASSALIVDGTIYAANVGDSTTYLFKRDGTPVKLSFDHKASNEEEKKRVKEAGGLVVWFGGWRVNGSLAVSRSIGDEHMSQQLIAEPHIFEHQISEDDDYLILSSDGLWDVFTPEKAEEFVRNWRDEHCTPTDDENPDEAEEVDDENAPNLAEALVREALQKDSRDNITTYVVFLREFGPSPRKDLFKSEIPTDE